jgi:hypothetical protein
LNPQLEQHSFRTPLESTEPINLDKQLILNIFTLMNFYLILYILFYLIIFLIGLRRVVEIIFLLLSKLFENDGFNNDIGFDNPFTGRTTANQNRL